jgi:hypothetical protein
MMIRFPVSTFLLFATSPLTDFPQHATTQTPCECGGNPTTVLSPTPDTISQEGGPGGGGEEGGGGTQGLTVTAGIAPGSTVILGTTVTLTVTGVTGGTAPFTCQWWVRCPPQNIAGELSTEEQLCTVQYCCSAVGPREFKVTVTDSLGNQGTTTVNLTVEAPDNIGIVPSAGNAESSDAPIMHLTHRFRLFKSGPPQTSVGPCVSLCCQEKVTDVGADPEETEWSDESCSAESSPGFYFATPDIVDTKVVIADASITSTFNMSASGYRTAQPRNRPNTSRAVLFISRS